MTERALLEQGLTALGVPFGEQEIVRLLTYSALLLEKNKVMNLTAITDPKQVVVRHLLDSAALWRYVQGANSAIDVGTGAGLPGIPLAILTGASWTLLDAQRKRVEFIHSVVDKLALSNCTAVHARAEEFVKEHRAQYEVAVSRAVAELRVLCELAVPLVRVGGSFYAMKAAGCAAECDAAKTAMQELGIGKVEQLSYRIPFSDMVGIAVCMKKEKPTPERYPRRFSKIQRAPL